ncbi:MAG: DUF3015 domain-containing protein [Gammaproteobacteria bacterium]|nr:DUF3015 domain-containing protein [Gammaproteobacteria bacterium]
MKRLLISSSVVLSLFSATAFADNGPGCGLGAQIWKGKKGLVAHTSAGTTNGTVSSPLFGLLSGTSGCENPGVVQNDHQQKVFVAMNMDDLATDMARGSGEHLRSMATLMGVPESEQDHFFKLSQSNYESIFSADNVSYDQVIAGLNSIIASDDILSQYMTKS